MPSAFKRRDGENGSFCFFVLNIIMGKNGFVNRAGRKIFRRSGREKFPPASTAPRRVKFVRNRRGGN